MRQWSDASAASAHKKLRCLSPWVLVFYILVMHTEADINIIQHTPVPVMNIAVGAPSDSISSSSFLWIVFIRVRHCSDLSNVLKDLIGQYPSCCNKLQICQKIYEKLASSGTDQVYNAICIWDVTNPRDVLSCHTYRLTDFLIPTDSLFPGVLCLISYCQSLKLLEKKSWHFPAVFLQRTFAPRTQRLLLVASSQLKMFEASLICQKCRRLVMSQVSCVTKATRVALAFRNIGID